MKARSLLCGLAYFAIPALVFGAIWYTVIVRYYVPNPIISPEMIERGRQLPSDAVLDELSGYRFFDDENHLFTVDEAEKILKGEFALPGEAPRKIHLPFDPQDIDQGSPYWQLTQARLIIPRILLAAYRATGREEFFITARDIILGWASYERRALVPRGNLWFDHAIAERVFALAEFWSVYRHHLSFDARVAEDLFIFVDRSRSFLEDPALYYRLSNHGVMQDMALWHVGLAFPTLPDASRYSQLAFERLEKLMRFYIDEQGVVLEHSAGYHKTGVQFLSLSLRYMTLLGIEVPQDWRRKFEKAQEVYTRLRRPDGSLPMFGDTDGGVRLPGPMVPVSEQRGRYGPLTRRVEKVQPRNELYPVAGYSVWWNGLDRLEHLSQTVIAWSYFPGFAHKHADEPSVLLWARGQTWWTNVGYWPYGTAERREAESWNGSNAPHLTNESVSSPRKVQLLGERREHGLSFIDLQRSGPEGYVVRRQVAEAGSSLWVVVDHTSGASHDRTTTLWTTAHDIQMREGQFSGSYDLTHPANGSVLKTFVFGSSGTSIREYRGSQKPFAGWQMGKETPKPASALMIEHPVHDSWAVAIWLFDDAWPQGTVSAMPSMDDWNGPENWMITVPMASGTIQLSRVADTISFRAGNTTSMVNLIQPSSREIEENVAEIIAAKERMKQEYPRPRFPDAVEYRFKATYFCIALLVSQEVFFFIYRRKFSSNGYGLVRGLSVIAWLMVGIWLAVIRMPLI